jgi:hypothetical protein
MDAAPRCAWRFIDPEIEVVLNEPGEDVFVTCDTTWWARPDQYPQNAGGRWWARVVMPHLR